MKLLTLVALVGLTIPATSALYIGSGPAASTNIIERGFFSNFFGGGGGGGNGGAAAAPAPAPPADASPAIDNVPAAVQPDPTAIVNNEGEIIDRPDQPGDPTEGGIDAAQRIATFNAETTVVNGS